MKEAEESKRAEASLKQIKEREIEEMRKKLHKEKLM